MSEIKLDNVPALTTSTVLAFCSEASEIIVKFSHTSVDLYASLAPSGTTNVAKEKTFSLSLNTFWSISIGCGISKTIRFKFVHRSNAYSPILVTFRGMIIQVKLVAVKAPTGIVVTPSGILIDVSALHP